jgi:hypothetical protein
VRTYFVKVKHEIQLTNVLKSPIQAFHKNLYAQGSRVRSDRARHGTHLDQIKNPKLTLGAVHDEDKVERSVTPIHDLPSLARSFVLGAQKCLQFWSIKEVA